MTFVVFIDGQLEYWKHILYVQ